MQQAVAAVRLPLRLNWSEPYRLYRLSDRRDRTRVYEIVLLEGDGADVEHYVDGALLVDLWGHQTGRSFLEHAEGVGDPVA